MDLKLDVQAFRATVELLHRCTESDARFTFTSSGVTLHTANAHATIKGMYVYHSEHSNISIDVSLEDLAAVLRSAQRYRTMTMHYTEPDSFLRWTVYNGLTVYLTGIFKSKIYDDLTEPSRDGRTIVTVTPADCQAVLSNIAHIKGSSFLRVHDTGLLISLGSDDVSYGYSLETYRLSDTGLEAVDLGNELYNVVVKNKVLKTLAKCSGISSDIIFKSVGESVGLSFSCYTSDIFILL